MYQSRHHSDVFWAGGPKQDLLESLVLKTAYTVFKGCLDNYMISPHPITSFNFLRVLVCPVMFPNNFACKGRQNN